MLVPDPILTLGASATPAIPAIPAVVAAMEVAAVPGVPAVAANAGVTQAQVDTSRVASEHFAVNEAKANTMILLTLEQKDVMTLLAFPTAAAKWAKLAADYVSISPQKASMCIKSFRHFLSMKERRCTQFDSASMTWSLSALCKASC